MCEMFPPLAKSVAEYFEFLYHQDEEDGMREYLRMVRG
jgi:aminoglycoside 6-adenylyltransferase